MKMVGGRSSSVMNGDNNIKSSNSSNTAMNTNNNNDSRKVQQNGGIGGVVNPSSSNNIPPPPPAAPSSDVSSSMSNSPMIMPSPWPSSSDRHYIGTPMSTSVHGKLMRSQHRRNPMHYYSVCSVLGEGSMGSVSKVKKKNSARGGSARSDFVKRQQGCCFQILSFCGLSGILTNKKKFIEISSDHVTTGPTSYRTDGYSSISSSIRDHNKRYIIGSYPPSRMTSQANSRCGTPTRELEEEMSGDILGDLPTSSRHNNNNYYNPKLFTPQTSSMITYGTKKETYYALKSILLDRCSNEEFRKELENEVEILKSLDHPNIVRALETFHYHNRLFIVLELCSGGDLYSRDPYSEEDAARIMTSLFSAVSYLHSRGIVHRDLKYENIMFADESPKAEIKIIDFGLSQKFAADEHLHDAVGTVYTMAPELIAGDYDAKADVWSLGVIAFMLLSSSMPFYGKDRSTIIKRILRGKYSFAAKRWKYVSSEAKEFVKTLLRKHAEKRPSAEVALNSPWLQRQEFSFNADGSTSDELLDNIQTAIHSFTRYQQLKKLALLIIAYKSTTDEVGFLRKIFGKFDKEHDSEITIEEFKEALSENYSYTDEEMENLFRGIDIDGTGKVHYLEFLAATIEAHGSLDEERLAEAFDRLDADDTGYIDADDIRDMLGDEVPMEEIDAIIHEADLNDDGRITYEEFLGLWDNRADEIRRDAKVDVGSRRVSRVNSFCSSTSSDDISDTTLQSDDTLNGTKFFREKKMTSVRNNSLTESMVNNILKEKGLISSISLRRQQGIQQQAIIKSLREEGDDEKEYIDMEPDEEEEGAIYM